MKKYHEGKITRTVESAEIEVFHGLSVAEDGSISAKHESTIVHGVPAEEMESYLRSIYPDYVQHRTIRSFFSRFVVPEQKFYISFFHSWTEVSAKEATKDEEIQSAEPVNETKKKGGKK